MMLLDAFGRFVLHFMVPIFGEHLAFYFSFGLLLGIPLFALVSIVALVFSPVFGWRRLVRALGQMWQLATLAFGIGALGNFVFIHYFRGRFYNPGDPMVDFLPFLPMLPYDESFGGGLLNGATDATLFAFWLVAAAISWLLASVLWLVVRGHLHRSATPN